jgi:assimilatory nitrate reductase catalytic subunit
MTAPVRTTCPYCGVGCGVLARRAESGAVEVTGDPEHPANRGRLCSKGTALAATVGLQGRLLAPQIEGRVVTWDVALQRVAEGLAQTIERHGPDSVAFYVSGQLLTEDYYVANKLMKGWIGTANIDTNSRLCMSSAVAGHQRAFGEDLVPVDYEDVELADLVVLVGSNTAWCHPVLMQRILAARTLRPQMRIIVIDPRRTVTCESADLHLPLRAGTDVLLFNGLLAWLADHGHEDKPFVATNTQGLAEALSAARSACVDTAATAQACGLDPALLQRFFEAFAACDRVVTLFSQGVNQSSAGTDKVNSIINCHLLTGRIGRPGMGPFSITGQPNAMGGREVGGLATQLAAHLSLENPAHRATVQTFWNSPRIAGRPGLKAVELFDAIDDGRVKAVWIMATNPVVSLPDADRVKRALSKCEFVVVSECVARTDTLGYAHVALPAAAWGEKEGTVTNSDRHISRQRAFLPQAGVSRPDWWIVSQVAQHMGYGSGFGYSNPAEIFAEHVRLTAQAQQFGRRFSLDAYAGQDKIGYDAMSPRQWPRDRLFADGRFATEDGRARFVPTHPRAPRHAATAEFPLVLNTGRIRDQWHGMSRTARAPQLNQHEPEPFVDLHRADAEEAGVRAGALVRGSSRGGSMMARARVSGDLPQGMAFAPIHWSDVLARDARVGAVVNPVVDPQSGEPEFKHTPVRIEPAAMGWYACLLTRGDIDVTGMWWSMAQGAHCRRYELAGPVDRSPDLRWLKRVLASTADDDDWIEYEDPARGVYRAAWFVDGRLEACLFREVGAHLPPREWIAECFGPASVGIAFRAALLTGRPPVGVESPGPVVCACFGVGAHTITRAAEKHGCTTVDAIGRLLRAGTNCGSCRPEIARLIESRGKPVTSA